jgi:hypothetical protein
LSTIDRIKEDDYFAPVSRSSCEPTGIDSIWSRTVIGKEGNLPGVINRSGLHIKVGPANGSGIRDLDVPFIGLAGANDYTALCDTTTHNGAESDLTRIIDIGHRTNRDVGPVLEARTFSAKERIRSASGSGIANGGHFRYDTVVPHEYVAVNGAYRRS